MLPRRTPTPSRGSNSPRRSPSPTLSELQRYVDRLNPDSSSPGYPPRQQNRSPLGGSRSRRSSETRSNPRPASAAGRRGITPAVSSGMVPGAQRERQPRALQHNDIRPPQPELEEFGFARRGSPAPPRVPDEREDRRLYSANPNQSICQGELNAGPRGDEMLEQAGLLNRANLRIERLPRGSTAGEWLAPERLEQEQNLYAVPNTLLIAGIAPAIGAPASRGRWADPDEDEARRQRRNEGAKARRRKDKELRGG